MSSLCGLALSALLGAPATPETPPLLPSDLATLDQSHWLAAVAFEFADRLHRDRTFEDSSFGSGLVDDRLLGLYLGYRSGPWGPHLRLMLSPDILQEIESTQVLFGIGERVHFSLWGHQWSYGVGAHVEARLDDHYWLTAIAPLEVGTRLHRSNTFELHLYTGIRRVATGSLINVFLLDPNGFNNDDAQAELDTIKREAGWQAFLTVLFARRL